MGAILGPKEERRNAWKKEEGGGRKAGKTRVMYKKEEEEERERERADGSLEGENSSLLASAVRCASDSCLAGQLAATAAFPC